MQALSKHWLERYGEESISNWFIEGLYTHAVVKNMTIATYMYRCSNSYSSFTFEMVARINIHLCLLLLYIMMNYDRNR